MKLLITSDLHLGINENTSILDYQIKVLNYITKIYRDYKCDYFCVAGDFFDKRKHINIDIFKNICEKFLDNNKDVNMIITAGNHDCYFRNTNETNSLSLLKSYNNIKIVDKQPYTLEKITFIPWINKDNQKLIEDYIFNDNSDYLICHIDVLGAKMDKINNFQGISSLDTTLLNNYKKVLSGHYHIKSEKDNIMYVGTPHQLTWIDVNVEKYIHILDTETGEILELLMPFELFKQFDLTQENWQEYCNEELKNKNVKIFYEDDIDKKWLNDIQAKFIQINPNIQFLKKNNKKKEKDNVMLDIHETLLDSIINYTKNIKPDNCDKVELLLHKVYNELNNKG